MITYHKGSLFDAPEGSLLGHACNCKGVWGSGIAVDFKERFPEAFKVYEARCQKRGGVLVGTSYTIGRVVCLFTSDNYGPKVDHPDKIVQSTKEVASFLHNYAKITEIHIPKINSGKFKVPWHLTEKVLKESPVMFHVWEQ